MRGRPREFDRDAVLEKAMRLFWERGYGATSVSDLVDETGIGRQSLYGAFGDKRRLFEEAFALYVRTELEPFRRSLEGPGSPGERVRAMLAHVRELAAREPQHGCMAVRTIASQCGCDPELASFASREMGRLEGLLTTALEQAMAAGESPPGRDARALARTTLATFNGMAALAPALPDPPALAEDVTRTLELLLLGASDATDETS